MTSDRLREQTKKIAHAHKASWLKLAEYLKQVYEGKHYKAWGFLTFAAYCEKELELKQSQISKMIKSYDFLEEEAPAVVKAVHDESAEKVVPNYESLNMLRILKQKQNLTQDEYAQVRHRVLDKDDPIQEVRAQVKRFLEERAEPESPEARRVKRNQMLRRLYTVLSASKQELQGSHLVPQYLIKQMADLAEKVKDQIE